MGEPRAFAPVSNTVAHAELQEQIFLFTHNLNIQTPHQRILCLLVKIGVPSVWMDVAGDPDLLGVENGSRSLRLNGHGVSISPSENVADIDLAAEFVHDDMLLSSVPVPELGVWILRVSIPTRGLPCSS